MTETGIHLNARFIFTFSMDTPVETKANQMNFAIDLESAKRARKKDVNLIPIKAAIGFF